MLSRRLLLAVAVLGGGAPAALAQLLQLPGVEVVNDPDAAFASFRTFRWKDSQTPADDPTAHASITWYTERALEKKGLKKTADPADLLVRYYAKGRKSLKGTPVQGRSMLPGGASGLTTRVDLQQVAEGTMILELYRASDEKLVWRAVTEWGSLDRKRLDAEIARAVKLLLTKYPPPPASKP